MEYAVKLNTVTSPDSNVRAFASVTFGDSFKITNIAVVEGKEKQLFVSMPSFKSKEQDGHNQVIYKDICNPITKDFRDKLYGDILGLYDQMKQSGKPEIHKEAGIKKEPGFTVRVTPFEQSGSSILGLARIYFEDSFVVGNVSILKGREKEFVAMPSYRTNQTGKDEKPQYQDVCFPVTKEFREKLYDSILAAYRQEKRLSAGKDKTQAAVQTKIENRGTDRCAVPH